MCVVCEPSKGWLSSKGFQNEEQKFRDEGKNAVFLHVFHLLRPSTGGTGSKKCPNVQEKHCIFKSRRLSQVTSYDSCETSSPSLQCCPAHARGPRHATCQPDRTSQIILSSDQHQMQRRQRLRAALISMKFSYHFQAHEIIRSPNKS